VTRRGPLVVTIDGPAGVGKSTVASRLAARLGWAYLDTGAMYRAVTWAALNKGADLDRPQAVMEVIERTAFACEADGETMRVRVNGVDVSEAIRDPELTTRVRQVASMPAVRERLVAMQRAFAARQGRIVTEGRDQGTVAFPEAVCKFFLTAAVEERAHRRQKQLAQAGRSVSRERLREDIERRDASDCQRTVGPLRPAPDAMCVDTTDLTAEQVVDVMVEQVRARVSPD